MNFSSKNLSDQIKEKEKQKEMWQGPVLISGYPPLHPLLPLAYFMSSPAFSQLTKEGYGKKTASSVSQAALKGEDWDQRPPDSYGEKFCDTTWRTFSP